MDYPFSIFVPNTILYKTSDLVDIAAGLYTRWAGVSGTHNDIQYTTRQGTHSLNLMRPKSWEKEQIKHNSIIPVDEKQVQLLKVLSLCT